MTSEQHRATTKFSEESQKFSSWTRKLKTLTLTSATIEPAAFFLMTSTLLGGMLMQDVQLLSACTVMRNNTRALCRELVKNNESFHSEEVAIQEVVAEAQSYSSIVNNVLALIFLLVAGPWSDRYGRRGPLLLSLGGAILSSGVMLVAALFYDQFSPYWIAIITSASSAVFGGETGFKMAAFSYLCDITDSSSRTFRTGIFTAAYHLGVPAGYAFVGVVIKSDLEHGYPIGFGIALVFALISFALVGVGVKGGRQNQNQAKRAHHKNYSTLAQETDKNLSFWRSLRNLLSSSLIPVFQLLRDQNRKRNWLILIILLHILCAAPIHGDASIFYLFLRQRLGWDAAAYGNFSIYDKVIQIIGMCGAVLVFNRWLKLSDPVFGFISTWSPLAASFLFAFAINSSTIWLAPVMDMLNISIYVVANSMLSKVVEETDVGKGVTLTAIFEAATPLLFIPIYSWIYTSTVATFAGEAFLLSATLTLGALLIFLWFIYDQKYAAFAQSIEENGKLENGVCKEGEDLEKVAILNNKSIR